MATNKADESIHTMNVLKEIQIAAPVEVAFEALLAEIGPDSQMPDGTPFPFKLEAWPGGRWYRDLGTNAGHLWGHVQVIKPPTLLEICGPMFMSYAATSHVQYRLTAEAGGTRLKMTYGALGQIPQEHREEMDEGWDHGLNRIRELAERQKGAAGGKR